MLLTIRTNIGTLSLFLFQVVSQSFQPFSQPHEAESLLTQGSYPSHPTLTHTQSNPTLCSRSVSPTPVNPNDNASTSLPHETNFTGQMEFLTGPNQYQRPLPPASSEESISDSQFSDEGQFNPLNMDHAISGSPYSFFPQQVVIEQPLPAEQFVDRQLFYPSNSIMQQISRSHPTSGFGMPLHGQVSSVRYTLTSQPLHKWHRWQSDLKIVKTRKLV